MLRISRLPGGIPASTWPKCYKNTLVEGGGRVRYMMNVQLPDAALKSTNRAYFQAALHAVLLESGHFTLRTRQFVPRRKLVEYLLCFDIARIECSGFTVRRD